MNNLKNREKRNKDFDKQWNERLKYCISCGEYDEKISFAFCSKDCKDYYEEVLIYNEG